MGISSRSSPVPTAVAAGISDAGLFVVGSYTFDSHS